MKTVAEFTLKRINETLHVKQVLKKDKVIHCSIVSSLEVTNPHYFEPIKNSL